MLRLALALLAAAAAPAAQAQDYAREARWRAEVVPNVVVGDAVDLRAPSSRAFLGLYAEGKEGAPAVLLVHGSGVHPNHGVIGMLRVALSEMGFPTLSIQMPVLAADAAAQDYYPALFPEAAARIATAAEWLKAKGHGKIVLASHSLGSWMSQHYLESARAAPFAGWISMGRAGELGKPPLPVLDVYGEKDFPGVLASAAARAKAIERIRGSRQAMVAGADHFYSGREEALARLLREFIDGL